MGHSLRLDYIYRSSPRFGYTLELRFWWSIIKCMDDRIFKKLSSVDFFLEFLFCDKVIVYTIYLSYPYRPSSSGWYTFFDKISTEGFHDFPEGIFSYSGWSWEYEDFFLFHVLIIGKYSKMQLSYLPFFYFFTWERSHKIFSIVDTTFWPWFSLVSMGEWGDFFFVAF